jgi:hypothetical protein
MKKSIEDREIEFNILEEQKAKTRRIAETILEMIDEDYQTEHITSYINQHLIIANKSNL